LNDQPPQGTHADHGVGSRVSAAAFRGFAAPTSNTTYAPNQFFDVCLPHRSRGCVRIVAYVLRKTLGWSDAEGNPQRERFAIGYNEIERAAGVGRDAIRSAVDEAVRFKFLNCLRPPSSNRAGKPGVTGLYELRWDGRETYVKDPAAFAGFFAGEGNRTYIPNQFFDHVVRNETLAVAKVVGSVIRFSIGFQTKWGHRRQQVSLSYQHVQNYAKIRDRKTLAAAIRHAVTSNYLQVVSAGVFDKDAGRRSVAAVYSVRWLSDAAEAQDGRKTPPGETAVVLRSENPTGNGRKTPPARRSENPTDIEITNINNTTKQQPDDAVAASFEELVHAGFDPRAAEAIARRYPVDRILNQIEWLPKRKATRNRLGMLRIAIEQDWPAPSTTGKNLGRPKSRIDALRDAVADKLTLRRE
jgi:hypothetical protein